MNLIDPLELRLELCCTIIQPDTVIAALDSQKNSLLWNGMLRRNFLSVDMIRALMSLSGDSVLKKRIVEGVPGRILKEAATFPVPDYDWIRAAVFLTGLHLRIFLSEPENSFLLAHEVKTMLSDIFFQLDTCFLSRFPLHAALNLQQGSDGILMLFAGSDAADWGKALVWSDQDVSRLLFSALSNRAVKLLSDEMEYWKKNSSRAEGMHAAVRICKHALTRFYRSHPAPPGFDFFLERMQKPKILECFLFELGIARFVNALRENRISLWKPIVERGLNQDAVQIISQLLNRKIVLGGTGPLQNPLDADREAACLALQLFVEGSLPAGYADIEDGMRQMFISSPS